VRRKRRTWRLPFPYCLNCSDAALDHFKKARNLYCGAGQSPDWEDLAGTVPNAHSRKRGFLAAFDQIGSGKSQRSPSFAEQAQEQWKRLTS
jgi:hypothetical protein